MKNYLTELASVVVSDDIELCAMCIGCYRDFLRDPHAAVTWIVESEVRSDGKNFEFLKSRTEVEHLVWLAQVRTVFPVLEEYREDFVQRHASVIARHLPITSSYGETYVNPEDVELGTLKYMADRGEITLFHKEAEQLSLYKEARNKLSHLTPLTLTEIKGLDT